MADLRTIVEEALADAKLQQAVVSGAVQFGTHVLAELAKAEQPKEAEVVDGS